eukprot:1656833-Pyramimonas_sp.AAC.1
MKQKCVEGQNGLCFYTSHRELYTWVQQHVFASVRFSRRWRYEGLAATEGVSTASGCEHNLGLNVA